MRLFSMTSTPAVQGDDCRAAESLPTPRLKFVRRLWRRFTRPSRPATTTLQQPPPSRAADAEPTSGPPTPTQVLVPASAGCDSNPPEPTPRPRSACEGLLEELQALDSAKSRDALLLETLKLRLENKGLESRLRLAELEHRADAVRLRIANGQIQTLNSRVEFYKEIKQALEASSVLSKLRVEQYDLEATQMVQYIEELTATQTQCIGLVNHLLHVTILADIGRRSTQGHPVVGSERNGRPPGLRPRGQRQ
ncbi:hypothetical protein H4R34_003687 [Dimargaris verticillata]|uniref:Uncharacterized protein n=1 Tax=Dimargaris verticillata TaxID=2761393 RepID=A0A9W8EBT2_9FUNG|nr:hypothetical protein H4R34_003687 [Dimargaris verticillata]